MRSYDPRRMPSVCFCAAACLAAVLIMVSCGGSAGTAPSSTPPPPPGGGGSSGNPTQYTTNFPLSENPISESGKWIVPSAQGLGNLWGDVQTSPGLAYGVSEPTQFGDPTAKLTGTWGADQTIVATVSVPGTITGACCHEVEALARVTYGTNSITGYEGYCSVMSSDPYCHIARWNGPNGSYCNLDSSPPSIYLTTGDVLRFTVTGTSMVTLTLYVNGIEELQVTDTGSGTCPGGGSGAAGPFASGNPGIGFYDNQDSNWNYFGFSQVNITDDSGSAAN